MFIELQHVVKYTLTYNYTMYYTIYIFRVCIIKFQYIYNILIQEVIVI